MKNKSPAIPLLPLPARDIKMIEKRWEAVYRVAGSWIRYKKPCPYCCKASEFHTYIAVHGHDDVKLHMCKRCMSVFGADLWRGTGRCRIIDLALWKPEDQKEALDTFERFSRCSYN